MSVPPIIPTDPRPCEIRFWRFTTLCGPRCGLSPRKNEWSQHRTARLRPDRRRRPVNHARPVTRRGGDIAHVGAQRSSTIRGLPNLCGRPVGETCRSPHQAAPVLSDLLSWLDELFDALRLGDEINLAGMSYGGALTAQYALHFPTRLTKLLLAPAKRFSASARALVRLALCLIALESCVPRLVPLDVCGYGPGRSRMGRRHHRRAKDRHAKPPTPQVLFRLC